MRGVYARPYQRGNIIVVCDNPRVAGRDYEVRLVFVAALQAEAYTRPLQSSTSGPSGTHRSR